MLVTMIFFHVAGELLASGADGTTLITTIECVLTVFSFG